MQFLDFLFIITVFIVKTLFCSRSFVIVDVSYIDIYLWSLGFRLVPGATRLQASAVSKKVGGLTSWSVELDSPGTALIVGGWIRPGGKLVG